jgi:hypothetical protein
MLLIGDAAVGSMKQVEALMLLIDAAAAAAAAAAG